MDMPIEFCALRFLLQWEQSEKLFHSSLKGKPSTGELRRALQFFQIARNFPRLGEEHKAQFIINALLSVDPFNEHGADQNVRLLAERLETEFEQFNLSAASKLLWLRHRRPYIIYDSRTVRALKNANENFDSKSYTEYCSAWKRQYRLHRRSIKSACERLVEIRGFFPAWHANEKAMLKATTGSWFRERVFDIYLWELGGEG